MTAPFEIDRNHIESLNDYDLTELLQRLLFLEAQKLGLPEARVSVSLSIDSPDGGEDGKIEWTGGPDPATSSWIPTRCTLFQVKATLMDKADCKKEVITKDGNNIKPRVKPVVKAGGSYVLFYGRSCEGQYETDRVDKIREAFTEKIGAPSANDVTIKVYGSEKIARWTNQHAAAVAFVMERRGVALPAAMQTWSSWEEEHPRALSFFLNRQRAAVIADLRRSLHQAQRCVRLVGLSGLGKSRAALEVFRPPVDRDQEPEQEALSRACVYMANGDQHASDVVAAIRGMKDRSITAVIVVDECPLDLHQKLAQIVRAPKSKLTLLTLDFDPSMPMGGDRTDYYCLTPLAQDEMEALLRGSALNLPDEHVGTVAAMADGFPRMAELLARLLDQGDGNLWALAKPEVFRDLVVRRAENPDLVWDVAVALAIVEHLGVDGDVQYELQSFCDQILGGLPLADVYRVVRDLEDGGIAYRRGDYVRLTPLPLAVVLAAKWWNGVSPEDAIALLTGDRLPQPVVDAVKSQLSRLRGHKWVEKLVAQIAAVTGPFGRRGLVDSATGSRLLSSLAEVNPEAVAKLLSFHFAAMTPEQSAQVVDGRRDLVWCLEKLAWWPTTFDDAAWMLLVFAAGENETWSNNATGQFRQLYHVFLAGTEVPALQRLNVIDRGLATSDVRIVHVCIQALVEALAAGHYHRMGGVESQGGSIARQDWAPSTRAEIGEYWASVLDRLCPYLALHGEPGPTVRRDVAERARGVIASGFIDLVEHLVDRVSASGVGWPEMLDALRTTANYDAEDVGSEGLARLDALAKRLEPTDLEGRLRLIVSTPSYNELRTEESGSVTIVAEERALALGAEMAAVPETLLNYLPVVLVDEQRQGFTFGRALGDHLVDPAATLKGGMHALRGLPPNRRNATVLMGLAASMMRRDPATTRAMVRGWLDDREIRGAALDILRAVGPDDEDAKILVHLLEVNDVDPDAIRPFAYGRATAGLSDHAVAEVLAALLRKGDTGAIVALELLGMRLHRENVPENLLAVSKEVLAAQRGGHEDVMSSHRFEDLARKVLKFNPEDSSFVAELTQGLIEGSQVYEGGRRNISSVLGDLLRVRPDVVWPLLRAELSSGDWSRAARVTSAMGKWFGEGVDLLALVGQDALLDWAGSSAEAAYWGAKLVEPLRSKPATSGDFPSWNPFVIELLRRHGSDKHVRSAVSAKISSGVWTGSAVPRLERQRAAFAELQRLNHPEVADWAAKALAYLDEEIAREHKRDEETEFGIFRR